MTVIQISPSKLRSTAQTLRQKAKNVQSALHNVDSGLKELTNFSFSGNRASAVRIRYVTSFGLLKVAANLILIFAMELESVAVLFEIADKRKINGADSSPSAANQPVSTSSSAGATISGGGGTTSTHASFAGTAEEVKAGARNSTEFGYPRNGYNGVQSDCTWYAAQAVYKASDGKVTVQNLGAATKWIENAKAKGFEVDHTAEAGSIIHFKPGHVGFIESVENKDGHVFVTWTEEQASGGRPAKDWSNVTQVGDQLRWRVTADLTNYFNNGNASCIHVDY